MPVATPIWTGSYAQATWTQGLADWISGHVGAFEAIGGVPAPDNTGVAVIKACLYDPRINRSYADMAAHYGTAILPARPTTATGQDECFILHLVLAIARRWNEPGPRGRRLRSL